MNSYKLKLTALTPIHIGTGEVYEPTNFVIDDGYLYEFDEILFYKRLSNMDKKNFIKIVEDGKAEALFEELHALIIKNKNIAKKVAYNKVEVSSPLESHYKTSISNAVQKEGKGKNQKKVFAKFEIQKTQRLLNNISTYISGSCIKGAISTAYQEFIFKETDKENLDELFNTQKLFKNLSISDSLAQNSTSKIGYSINKERFEEDESQISTMMEVNLKESSYLINLKIGDLLGDDNNEITHKITKESIIHSCNSHYLPIYKKGLKLKENQFLLRVGKHSGARAVTIEGLRKILVKLCQIQNKREEGNNSDIRISRLYKKSHFENSTIETLLADSSLLDKEEKETFEQAIKFLNTPSDLEDLVRNKNFLTINAILKEETTSWFFGESKKSTQLSPFGWVLCEFIEEDKYKEFFDIYKALEKTKISAQQKRQKEIRELIKNEENNKREEALKKQQQKEDEAKKEIEEEIRRKEALAKMTPLEKIINSLYEANPNKSETIDIVIYTAIKDKKLDEFKCEALQILKNKMIELKKWVEVSKNPKKDKKHKRTKEIIEMIKEC